VSIRIRQLPSGSRKKTRIDGGAQHKGGRTQTLSSSHETKTINTTLDNTAGSAISRKEKVLVGLEGKKDFLGLTCPLKGELGSALVVRRLIE